MGCSYGMNLIYCLPDSYGIEVEESAVQFARSLGLTVYQRNILNDDLTDLPDVEVIWCSAVLEHVDSPHSFLRKLHLCLKPHGLLALYVPTLPLFPRLRYLPKMGRYFSGYVASDHINALVPSTLQFFCERAGFKTIKVSPFYPGPLGYFNRAPLLRHLIDGSVYVGRKIEGWEYPEKATRRVASGRSGFVMRGQQFPDCEMQA
jgi:SAM-dependent methyltransferase